MFKELKARLFPALPREQKLEGVTTNGQKINIKLGNNLSIDKNGLEYTINAEGGGGEITPESLLENMEGSDYISVDLNEDESKVLIELDQTKVDTVVTEDSDNLITSGAVFEQFTHTYPLPTDPISNTYSIPCIDPNGNFKFLAIYSYDWSIKESSYENVIKFRPNHIAVMNETINLSTFPDGLEEYSIYGYIGGSSVLYDKIKVANNELQLRNASTQAYKTFYDADGWLNDDSRYRSLRLDNANKSVSLDLIKWFSDNGVYIYMY